MSHHGVDGVLAEAGAQLDDAVALRRRLHEHPEYNFSTKSNPGAKGKYLEDPAVQNKKELLDIVAKEAGRA